MIKLFEKIFKIPAVALELLRGEIRRPKASFNNVFGKPPSSYQGLVVKTLLVASAVQIILWQYRRSQQRSNGSQKQENIVASTTSFDPRSLANN